MPKIQALSPLQLECIRIVHEWGNYTPSTWDIAMCLPEEMVLEWDRLHPTKAIYTIESEQEIKGYMHSRLGAYALRGILGYLEKAGYLTSVKHKISAGSKRTRTESFWSLGPLSDKLIEDSILS